MFLIKFLVIAISTKLIEDAKIIEGEKCSLLCKCQRDENSSKVNVAECLVTSQNTLLICSVEWPVLYLKVEMNQFDSNLLQRCQRIKKLLILADSQLTALRSDMFLYGMNLETLIVKAPIQTLDSIVLRHLPSLKQLDISETKIDSVSRSIFEECPISDTLRLALNKIVSIEDGSFKKCIYILTLDLSGNILRKIRFSTFEGAFNLKELDLSRNQIEIIDDLSFKHLKKLKKLSLKENSLQSVRQDTFRSLDSLTHLRLENNKIVYIALDAFKDLKTIQMINLKDNKISRLDLVLFINLKYLKVIFPEVDCVQSRDDDSCLVSPYVQSEFFNYPHCDGVKRTKINCENVQERQSLVQQTPEKMKDDSTDRSRENESVAVKTGFQPYLIWMIMGGLTITLISIIVVSVVCHVKNKRIHELQLQEVQLPMMQSTL